MSITTLKVIGLIIALFGLLPMAFALLNVASTFWFLVGAAFSVVGFFVVVYLVVTIIADIVKRIESVD